MYGRKYMGIERSAFLVDGQGQAGPGLVQGLAEGHAHQFADRLGQLIPVGAPDWQLGIDLGTSYTVAAVASEGAVAVLDLESTGHSRIPSSVFVSKEGELLVGTKAQHQAVFAPDRFEATPKRWIGDGELFLGDGLVKVTELLAAILRYVFVEAARRYHATMPSAVRLTHPAGWESPRLLLLRDAAERAGLPEVEFVPEPVAAALWIAGAATEPGDRIAVFDFGGGTFDAAVLSRTDTGFEVTGPPAGRDPLGGEDIDQHIIDYIGTLFAEDAPTEWASLCNPPDVSWRRKASMLRAEVQRAKETLSEANACQLWIPGLECEMQLSRSELDKLISADVETCTDILLTALADASVPASELTGLYLVGGSSRIPLVSDVLWKRVGVQPRIQDSPKSVVALGAASGRPLGVYRAPLKPAVLTAEPGDADAPSAGAPGAAVGPRTGSLDVVVGPPREDPDPQVAAVASSVPPVESFGPVEPVEPAVPSTTPERAGLQVGDVAPPFVLSDIAGRVVQLSDFAGRPVVLHFSRGRRSTSCWLLARDLQKMTAQVGVVGISMDSAEDRAKLAKDAGVAFPLLCDPDHGVAEAYGVWFADVLDAKHDKKLRLSPSWSEWIVSGGKDRRTGIMPAVFLIDAQGKVAGVWHQPTTRGTPHAVWTAWTQLPR